MRTLILAFLLIGWCLATIILVCTFIGLVVVMDEGWTDTGKRILDAIVNECE